ncbi:hypothetical protein B0H17DRAFT_1140108 [Mycena rosella]|uniref:Uncharacterized protein n=1 Tax=Mycena rosella TaxID=1033263 RepID=A0AAD7D380_MYCRO|nr:hypothetical protein B0H17DRAFT_1140108 [Mycena rosella]
MHIWLGSTSPPATAMQNLGGWLAKEKWCKDHGNTVYGRREVVWSVGGRRREQQDLDSKFAGLAVEGGGSGVGHGKHRGNMVKSESMYALRGMVGDGGGEEGRMATWQDQCFGFMLTVTVTVMPDSEWLPDLSDTAHQQTFGYESVTEVRYTAQTAAALAEVDADRPLPHL